MVDTIELKVAMLRAGISGVQLAKALNVSKMTLLRKMKNESKFKADELHLVEEILGLTPAQRENIFFPGSSSK